MQKKIIVEVIPVRGNPDLFIHGYNQFATNRWRTLRSSTSPGTSTGGITETLSFRKSGFFDNEKAYINIYATTATTFEVNIYVADVDCKEFPYADQSVNQIYNPVCGCDGQKYSNPQSAIVAGVTAFISCNPVVPTELASGVYTIQQKSNGRFVDAHEHQGEDYRLVTRTAQNNDTQEWTFTKGNSCLLYTSPSPRDATLSRMPSSA